MSTIIRRVAQPGGARVAVLAPRWGGAGEAAWALRQVAGALALSGDVHVFTPGGAHRGERRDGVLTVHEAGAGPGGRFATRRDLLLSIVRRTEPAGTPDHSSIASLLDAGQEGWALLAGPLGTFGPDLVVLADHREVGAARLADQVCPGVPVLSVPLAVHGSSPSDPWFSPSFARAGAAIVFSGDEASLVGGAAPGIPVADVGLPLAANPSVQREPLTFVRHSPYVLVLSAVNWDAAEWPVSSVRLLLAGLPDIEVVVSAPDRLVRVRRGEEEHTGGVERGTDLLRLLAWSRATVELHPGPLYSRHSLDALLYGSPVVVPARGRARQHAERGRAGLWFSGAGELLWATRELLDDTVHDALAGQGRAYATERYCGTDVFVERVNRAVAPLLSGAVGRG